MRLARAVLTAAAIAAAAAPAAQARPTIVVQAAATAIHQVEVMDVHFQCSAASVTGRPVYMRRCSFGPIYASTSYCLECVQPPAAIARGNGNLAVGLPYDLCVTAETYGPSGTERVSKCAPFSYLTNSAVIAG